MKKVFTKLTQSVLFGSLLLTAFNGSAQTSTTTLASAVTKADKKSDATTVQVTAAKPADADTTFKPSGKLWGYSFGDFYYAAHTDAANRGAETNYNGVANNRNAFQIRRVYLGYDYNITKKFSAELLLEAAPSANTGTANGTSISNGDNLVDGKMSFYIKNINLRWKGFWTGTDLVIGEMATPAFSLLSEKVWGYRSIEKTVADLHKTNSYDLGIALQGVFDPKTKNYGYNVMLGNNTGASLLGAGSTAPNTGMFKQIYADVYAKFLDQKLIFDVYYDHVQTASTSVVSGVSIGQQAHRMWKGFAAYTTPELTVGIEAYSNKIANGVLTTTTDVSATKGVADATVKAFSAFIRGTIVKNQLGFFARYDGYNPNDAYSTAYTYAKNTNLSSYDPNTKEKFYTLGLDFTPTKNVHFMPNMWLVDYKDLRAAGTGVPLNDHTLVWRATFFFTFGK